MATAEVKISASTTDTTSYTTSSLTPTLNDFLVVLVFAPGTVDPGALTDSLGGTYTKITSFTAATGTGYIFVADQLAPATGLTLTFTCSGDAATGCIINAFAVTGVTKVGSAAARGSGAQSNQSLGTTPAPALSGGAALTGNAVLGMVMCTSLANFITPPASFTEARDNNITTPQTGYESVFIDSGFTSSTVTWGSTCPTAWGAAAVEIDRTAAAGNVTVTGVRAAATATAQAGSPVVAILGVQAAAPASAQTGSPVVVVTGSQATATATGQAGVASSSSTVIGARATATATGQAGDLHLTLTGAQAAATATAQPGSAGTTLTVVGARATATATAQAGVYAYTGTVLGAQGLATATGNAGVVSYSGAVLGAQAQAVATANPGVPTETTGPAITTRTRVQTSDGKSKVGGVDGRTIVSGTGGRTRVG